jgi:hypothetical protein
MPGTDSLAVKIINHDRKKASRAIIRCFLHPFNQFGVGPSYLIDY